MSKVNLQIRVPAEVAGQIKSLSPSRTEFVRRAIMEKIKRDTDRQKEEQWIEALKKNPEDMKEAMKWIRIQKWD
ncbi:MAG: hypothetical protein HYU99_06125 [Deltaproteobacteria bacterium]|nr:hypothetical protein [Deltaproteobacteria bacterium]